MASLKHLIDKPIQNITFKFNEVKDLIKLKNLSNRDGQTEIKILLNSNTKIHEFKLKNKRKLTISFYIP